MICYMNKDRSFIIHTLMIGKTFFIALDTSPFASTTIPNSDYSVAAYERFLRQPASTHSSSYSKDFFIFESILPKGDCRL